VKNYVGFCILDFEWGFPKKCRVGTKEIVSIDTHYLFFNAKSQF